MTAEAPISGCFYCAGPDGRNPWCPEHGDDAILRRDLARYRSALQAIADMNVTRETLAGAVITARAALRTPRLE